MKRGMKQIAALIVSQALLTISASAHDASHELSAKIYEPETAQKTFDTTPLSLERMNELGQFNKNHEFRAQYGLLDHGSQYAYFANIGGQRGSLMEELASRQADFRLKGLKTKIEAEASHSVVAKSALMLTAAYLIYNGKPIKTKLAEDTELSARAKPSERALTVTQRNLSPLNLISGIDYQLNSGSVTTSISKELAPHIVASVDQRRDLSSASVENTGRIVFGASF